MKLISFDYFRALAILIIVAGHSFGVVNLQFTSIGEVALQNLIAGGTSLFVFISGYLFHHVFYSKFLYFNFMIKKIKNVLLPYLILGFLPVIIITLKGNDMFDGYFLPTGTGIIYEYIIPICKYLWSGRFLVAYWYIPFIMVMFLLSPLHCKFVKIQTRKQLYIILFLSLISLYVQRPIGNMSVFHSVVYFTPIYLLGIWSSINIERIYTLLNTKKYYFLLIAIFLSFFQAYIGERGNYNSNFFDYNGIDLMFLQKILLCFFLLLYLKKYDFEKENKYISLVAQTSFTTFFIHPIILNILGKLNFSWLNLNSWIAYIIVVFLITSISILFAIYVKKVLQKKSRYFIGY